MSIQFRPITTEDLPLLHEWLNRPHVAERWDRPMPVAEVESHYTPCIDGTDSTRIYFALLDGEPVGFIQAYVPTDSHPEGWWLDEHDPGVRGIDQFLANADQLDQGLGTRMVRAFIEKLFEDDPGVTRIQTDPSPTNPRAIRCYEKAGFRRVRELETPDGPALLMYRDRPVP